MTLYHNDQPITSIVKQTNSVYNVNRERAALLTDVRQGDIFYVRLLSGYLLLDLRHTTSFAGFLVYPTA